jgi:CHAT domain-containing protein
MKFDRGRSIVKRRIFIAGLLLFSLLLPVVTHRAIAKTPVVTEIQAQADGFQLGEDARQFYRSRQYDRAVRRWREAIDAFARRGDRLNQARSLNNLSLSYQHLGDWQKAREAIADSLGLLAGTTREEIDAIAHAYRVRGRLQLALGRAENALESWQQAIELYNRLGDREAIRRTAIDRAQAFKRLGFYPRSCETILSLLDLDATRCEAIGRQKPDEFIAKLDRLAPTNSDLFTLKELGDLLAIVGYPRHAKAVLNYTLERSRTQPYLDLQPSLLLSLGNTHRILEQVERAIDRYQTAEIKTSDPVLKLRARLNQLSLQVAGDRLQNSAILSPMSLSKIREDLDRLPPSSTAIELRLNFIHSLACLQTQHNPVPLDLASPIFRGCHTENQNNFKPTNLPSWDEITTQVQIADRQAESIGNPRLQAQITGYAGAIAQQQQQLKLAEELTKNALQIAESLNSPELGYRWQWQLGRLEVIKGNRDRAIAAYHLAFENLQILRGDLVAINPDIQFNFRDSVEPVYREYVDLLLKPERVSQANLKQARKAIEALQLAELNDFFREACLDAKPEQIDRVVDQAQIPSAVVYAIVLTDRVEVIVKLPQKQELQRYRTWISQSQIRETLNELSDRLSDRTRLAIEIQELSQQFYDWLIRPGESLLEANSINTLVFVLDSQLRNLPMSVLHDGDRYLIEKYAIALTPGLQLLNPRPLTELELTPLTAGLSEERTLEERNLKFSPLPNVPIELTEIESILPKTQTLLNREFVTPELQEKLKKSNYNIVHLATHGQFSSNLEDTFILTWDALLDIDRLNNLLERDRDRAVGAIELLVLSACETASGDNRATLGLAGVAVKAGARSTLATLWSVNDESTAQFMEQFYRKLIQIKANQNIGKAEVLRQAQLSLLANQDPDKKWNRPYYWAPFILVGNWL